MQRLVGPFLWLSLLAFFVAGALGFWAHTPGLHEPHLTLGLGSAVALALAHCLVLIWLAGAAKAIRARTQAHGLTPEALALVERLKRLAYPWLVAALLLLVAAVVSGAATDTRALPPLAHGLIALLVFAANARAVWREVWALKQLDALWAVFHAHLDDVLARQAAEGAPLEPAGETSPTPTAQPLPAAAVVLAGGASTRLGEPKALARLGGECVARRLVRLAAGAGCAPIIVVCGPDALAGRDADALADGPAGAPADDPAAVARPRLAERLRERLRDLPARIVEHPGRDRGRTSSVQAGVRAVRETAAPNVAPHVAIVLAPVDVPCVRAADFLALRRATQAPDGAAVLVAPGGRGGHPVWLGPALIERVLALAEDAPLRWVVRGDVTSGIPAPSVVVPVEAGHEGPVLAVKTPADLGRARAWLAAESAVAVAEVATVSAITAAAERPATDAHA